MEGFSHVILNMYTWEWYEEAPIMKSVLLLNDETLNACAREVITNFCILHNQNKPKGKLPEYLMSDIKTFEISKQPVCGYTNNTMLEVFSYGEYSKANHIEVIGKYVNAYMLLGE